MDQEEVRTKVEAVIKEYSKHGVVSDVWLSADSMATLDPRPPMVRITEKPYKIEDVYVTSFAPLKYNEFRVALTSRFEALDEPSSSD